MIDQSDVFDRHRSLLFSIAYRMLGSAMDAEDLVQETWLRWQSVNQGEVENPKAFLSTVVTRLSMDQLRSARSKREVYIGPWLPEPLLTGPELPEEAGERAESLSMAFLVVLESLAPLERAVFLLREVFDYDYAEIAGIVEKSEANCRQLVHRTRQRLAERRKVRQSLSAGRSTVILNRFLQACSTGDMAGLIGVLTEDIVLRSDGGGRVTAARQPIFGAEKVARFLLGVIAKGAGEFRVEQSEINGQPGLVIWEKKHIYGAMSLDYSDQQITHISLVVNPDKLKLLESRLLKH